MKRRLSLIALGNLLSKESSAFFRVAPRFCDPKPGEKMNRNKTEEAEGKEEGELKTRPHGLSVLRVSGEKKWKVTGEENKNSRADRI